jgi:hypothetical protein
MGQSLPAYLLGALPAPWSESSESETANPCLPILEIKVADKTNTSLPTDAGRVEHSRQTTGANKMQRLPLAKLAALAACVSVLAALFLAALPSFRSDIVPFQTRVGLFTLRYTMPICLLQIAVFWILYVVRKR